MYYTYERARTQTLTAADRIGQRFPAQSALGALDAEFCAADRAAALGFAGLPFAAPICAHLMNCPEVAEFLARQTGAPCSGGPKTGCTLPMRRASASCPMRSPAR